MKQCATSVMVERQSSDLTISRLQLSYRSFTQLSRTASKTATHLYAPADCLFKKTVVCCCDVDPSVGGCVRREVLGWACPQVGWRWGEAESLANFEKGDLISC